MTNKEEKDYQFLPVDPLLQYIILLTDEAGIGIPVTLMVKGMLIIGKTIKRDKSYDRVITLFGDPTNFINSIDVKSSKVFAEHFSRMLMIFRESPDEPGKISKPIMIHLEDVHIMDISTGQQLEMKDGLWRGNISLLMVLFLETHNSR
jgi:hypothetical protein